MRTEEKNFSSLIDLDFEKNEKNYNDLLLEFYQCSIENIDKIKEICEKLSSNLKILFFIVQDKEESFIKREIALKKLLESKNLIANNHQLFIDLIKETKNINLREKIFEKIKDEIDIIKIISLLNYLLFSIDQQESKFESLNFREELEKNEVPFLIFHVFQEKIKNYDIVSLFLLYFPQNHLLIKKEIIYQIKRGKFDENEKFASFVGLLKKEKNQFLKKEILQAIFSLKKTNISDLKFLIKKEENEELKLLIIEQIAKKTSFNFILENIYKKETNRFLLEEIAQILIEKKINIQETINLINFHEFVPQCFLDHLKNLASLANDDELYQLLLFQRNHIVFFILLEEIKKRGKVDFKIAEIILKNLKNDNFTDLKIIKIILKAIITNR